MPRPCLLLILSVVATVCYSQTMTVHLKNGKRAEYNLSDIDRITYSTIAKVMEAPKKPGLLAYYSFSGNTNDESGNGHNAFNTGVQPATDRFGNQDACMYFYGDRNYLTIPNNPAFNNLKELTIAAWIRTSNKDWSVILSKGDNRKYQYGLTVNTGNVMIAAWTYTGENHLRTEGFAADGQWHYVVGVVREDNFASLYIDGVLRATDNSPKSVWCKSGDADIKIGCRLTNGHEDGFFKGYIDDVSIYNRVLPENEILALYHAGGWK